MSVIGTLPTAVPAPPESAKTLITTTPCRRGRCGAVCACRPRSACILQNGTTAVRDYCIAQGYDRAFAAVGARMLQLSCGGYANCGPGSATDAGQVTMSAINRNFPGRSGPGQVWLASPHTVMASALAGELMSFVAFRSRAAGKSEVLLNR